MTEKPVLTRVIESTGGNILQITMNRPEVHNACNGEMAKYLLEAWLRFRDDDSLTVAVLHGAGDKSFCAGADLTALDTLAGGLLNSTSPDAAALERYAQNDPGPMGGSRIVQQKPVITVSHGYTYAGGLELFCHGHIRIAEPQARMGRRNRQIRGGAIGRRGDCLPAEAFELGCGAATHHYRAAHSCAARVRNWPCVGARKKR